MRTLTALFVFLVLSCLPLSAEEGRKAHPDEGLVTISFTDVKLEDMCRILQSTSGTPFVFKDPKLTDIPISGKVEDVTVPEFVEYLNRQLKNHQAVIVRPKEEVPLYEVRKLEAGVPTP